MSHKLRPCPFCGSNAQVNTWTTHGITESRCFCSNSDCPNSVRTVALEQWNTRPIEDALNKRIAEMEEFIDKLIEVSEKMFTAVIAAADSYDEGMRIWDALVNDWKEREE